ncbi:hypothetical protein MHBO_003662, partial [Bonamia ostreae]
IKRLIKILDGELDSILQKDMSPMETALLILLYRKHTEEIARNASNSHWKWEEGSLKKEYQKRRENIMTKRSIANTAIQKTTDEFMKEIEK